MNDYFGKLLLQKLFYLFTHQQKIVSTIVSLDNFQKEYMRERERERERKLFSLKYYRFGQQMFKKIETKYKSFSHKLLG